MKFYITTTLPYVNADPHIGFAMEIIRADAVARYHRLLGDEVIFNTGTDEHGKKIYQKALEENKDPQTYCDEHAKKFAKLKTALNLSYTNFIRTTDTHHVIAAQEFWKRCQKDIYKARYQIKYCVGCELEKTDSELQNGRCLIHPNRDLEVYDEENYFFRFSRFQKPLLDFYEKNPDFVIPNYRFDEIKNFVESGLKDFSISRLKEKMPWGVPVPNDPKQIMYVWFDALVNYISTLGWPENEANFKNFWPGVQIAGKDNLRQQAAMWQAMLISAGLPNSKQIYIEGFITYNGQKMSKSLGNVVDPISLVKKYGIDPVRYYLLREIPSYADGDFSQNRFKEIYNADLANGLGNLVARLAKLCEKNQVTLGDTQLEVKAHLQNFDFNSALGEIWKDIKNLDLKIDKKKPWSLSKQEADPFLKICAEDLRKIAFALKPFLPETADKILKQFTNTVKSQKPLFPRIA